MEFPTGERLNRAKPVYEYFPGFKTDITGCRKMEDLPKEAIDYIRYIEEKMGCPVRYVSVGAERNQYIQLF